MMILMLKYFCMRPSVQFDIFLFCCKVFMKFTRKFSSYDISFMGVPLYIKIQCNNIHVQTRIITICRLYRYLVFSNL